MQRKNTRLLIAIDNNHKEFTQQLLHWNHTQGKEI